MAALLLTMVVFTFVLLLGNALKEILPLLQQGQVSFGFMAQSIGLLVPFVWVFALPMGMLTATLLIFGRFSADQEYTAVRASGISLLSLSSPILLLSIALCGVCALINMELGPRCRVAYTTLLSRLRAEFSADYLPERTPIKEFADTIFYVGKNRKGELEDVWIFKLQNQTNIEQTVHARRGKIEIQGSRVLLTLYDGQGLDTTGSQSVGSFEETFIEFNLDSQKKSGGKLSVDDMSFSQLWDELAAWQLRLSPPTRTQSLTPEKRRAKEREMEEIRRKVISPMTFHLHRQVAFSFACFGFTLVGIPLGIRVQRRETNIGIALALILVGLYYGFILAGQSLSSRPEYFPHLWVWAPNFLFQSVGVFLLWRANR